MFFPPGMIAVIKKRHAFPHIMRDMLIFAKEFDAEEALKWNLIDGIWSEQEALEAINEKASDLSEYGYNKANMKLIKS